MTMTVKDYVLALGKMIGLDEKHQVIAIFKDDESDDICGYTVVEKGVEGDYPVYDTVEQLLSAYGLDIKNVKKKTDKDYTATVKAVLKENYGSATKEFDSIEDDYLMTEFYEALLNHEDAVSRLHMKCDEKMRQTVGRLLNCSKYVPKRLRVVTEQWMKNNAPERLLDDSVLLEKLLYVLTEKLGYKVLHHDTHRWVDTDGWYEVEFELEAPDGERIYIHTECGDQDLEDSWGCSGERYCEVSEMIYYLWKDDKYILRSLYGEVKHLGSQIPTKLWNEIKDRCSDEVEPDDEDDVL